MFYLRMAWRSLLRSRGLTAVMIAALSLGIGTWYLQHQIFEFLDGKTPDAPPALYLVELERGDLAPAGRPGIVGPLVPSLLLTPRDARAVVALAPGRKAITFGASGLLDDRETLRVRYASRDLFEMFAIPFAAGQPWAGEREAVIDEELADRELGGAASAIGRALRVDGIEVKVVGVVAAAHADRFHLYERFVTTRELVYLPLERGEHAEADFQHAIAGGESGSTTVWVELTSPAERAAFLAAVESYLARERASGRTATPRSVSLRSAAAWREAFQPGGTINLWPLLSGLCLVTSILNLVRMLIAKFAGRGHDLGLLRAFGARRREVMGQLLLEAMLIGLVAGALGIGVGLAMMPVALGTIAHIAGSPSALTASSVALTLAASVGAALLAALFPAWRLSRGTPAAQLRGGRK